jgi:hypothetical protein
MVQTDGPNLTGDLTPPLVRGAERLTASLLAGVETQALLAELSGPFASEQALYGALFDTATLAMLMRQNELGLQLQRDLLTRCRLFRVQGGPVSARPIRVLAIAAPGDLQMNLPIEFITAHLDVQLDLLFLTEDGVLPPALPDHDVAFCVASDLDPVALHRCADLLRSWPRPVLNDPNRLACGRIEDLTRAGIAACFADAPGVYAPPVVSLTRAALAARLDGAEDYPRLCDGGAWPLLVRQHGAHAGASLAQVADAPALRAYLDATPGERFDLTRFVDYRDADGLYRKRRVALIQGEAFLCHMGVSDHWMIHYLNAGMDRDAAKRADEAAAMAAFETEFAPRHATAFATLQEGLGLDYMVLDCAEAPDGRLLLFEVEMAAIVHLLDPASLFPYKPPQMRLVFQGFQRMLQRAAGPDAVPCHRAA